MAFVPATPPDSTKRSLRSRLITRIRECGPDLADLTSGYPVGTPEEALDCACGLYLNDPTAWTKPPTN
jgi:hypothetical protein